MTFKTLFSIALLACFFSVTFVNGHSYVTSPTSRGNQKQSTTGCRGPNCLGPCDQPASQARTPITIQRGASINVQWPRNNHAGGFIRFAWAPTSNSDTHSAFDNNVQEIVCHERGGCKPDDPSNPNGGDSNPSDGSRLPCQATINVPPHLTDGLWTLQWAWFGGAFSLGDYYSCVDYQISGGASGSAPTPSFVGGDYTYPGQQKCKFFNTDRLHRCVNEPCNNPVYSLSVEQSGAPYGISSSATPPPPTPPATTGSTTAPKVPATTGSTTAPKVVQTTTTSSTTAPQVIPQTTTTSSTTAPQVIPQTTTTTGNPKATTTGATKLCYLPNTPNPNGKIRHSPPVCGVNAPSARCADGQCCSKYGYCGPIQESDGTYHETINGVMQQVTYAVAQSLYCVNNTGDYRKYPCNTLGSNAIVAPENDYTDGDLVSKGLIVEMNRIVLLISMLFVIVGVYLF